MKILFTSDHHFFHKNVIKYSKRPFSSVEEMNEVMIEKWNEKVNTEDVVYHLGDISLGNKHQTEYILGRLNGRIHLITGNHEHSSIKNKWRFESINGILHIKVPDSDVNGGNQKITLCHYSLQVWKDSHYGSWCLYGHSHCSLAERKGFKSCDVGVDCWNFYPVTYDELKNKFSDKFYDYYKPIDHHVPRNYMSSSSISSHSSSSSS